ncbi:hypothetical protein [Streptacidiphilus sp. PAMC 29251]
MSERRDRRRLHARARALGVPIEQARRHPVHQPRPQPPAEPAWPRTELPDRDEDRLSAELPDRDEYRPAPQEAWAPAECCTVTRTRQVLAGGTVVMLTVHAAGCTVWTAR